ncbi:MAG: hypothetical protein IJA65_00825 [Acholeplasmatales bacterium]|nr:hypothetical protein [Acholeplasmatales bacterium]
MSGFSQFYVQFIIDLWNNICEWFMGHVNLIIKIFYGDWAEAGGYFDKLSNAIGSWNALDYIAFILILIVNIGFVALAVILLAQLIKRYFKFAKREIDKDSLVEEVSLLNQKVVELIDEKNKILAMRVSQIGAGTQGMVDYEGASSGKKKKDGDSRFSKLIQVDQLAAENPRITVMNQSDMLDLSDLVDRFIGFSASQLKLFYTREIIARWFAGLATSKVLILEGISGTGKTSLPYAMGKFFQNDTSIISVQPSWRDRAELLGYLNEFTKRFNETDFLKSVYAASYSDTINIIVLDEMNLARIEYYFAEFLSVMEMPDTNEWKIDIVPVSEASDPKNLINGKILIPQNLWFIGTANKDDSTFTITDKVYDRAVAIAINKKADFIDAPYTDNISMTFEYLDDLFKRTQSGFQLSEMASNAFNELDQFIQDKFKIAFGNRIMKQIKLFVPVYMACGFSEFDGLDYMLTFKILRKFEMLNLTFLKKELDELILLLDKLFGKEQFKVSKDFISDLKKMA